MRTRYWINEHGEPIESTGNFGEWVTYKDYAALEAEIERLTKELQLEQFTNMDECSRSADLERQLAACRAEIDQLQQALKRTQNSLDIMANTHTQWAKEYQDGKMALRRVPELEAEVERLTKERDGLREQLAIVKRTQTFEQTCEELALVKQQLAACREEVTVLRKIELCLADAEEYLRPNDNGQAISTSGAIERLLQERDSHREEAKWAATQLQTLIKAYLDVLGYMEPVITQRAEEREDYQRAKRIVEG